MYAARSGLLFRDHGDRYIRMYARLKFVVHRLGIDRCREIVNGYLDQDGIDRSGFEIAPVADCGPAIPHRPLRDAKSARQRRPGHPADQNSQGRD